MAIERGVGDSSDFQSPIADTLVSNATVFSSVPDKDRISQISLRKG